MSHFVASAQLHANNTRMFMVHGDKEGAKMARMRADIYADKAARHALNTGTLAAAKNAAKAREHAVRARKYLNGKFGRFTVR